MPSSKDQPATETPNVSWPDMVKFVRQLSHDIRNNLNAVELQMLQQGDIPLVLIGRPAIHVKWPYVSIDNRLGGRLATRHLIQIGWFSESKPQLEAQ